MIFGEKLWSSTEGGTTPSGFPALSNLLFIFKNFHFSSFFFVVVDDSAPYLEEIGAEMVKKEKKRNK